MLIAGETSGDMLAAELVRALRAEIAAEEPVLTKDYQPLETSLEPRFFGAGGQHMAAAGVDLVLDMTQHAVTGLSDVLKNLMTFRRLHGQLLRLARERQPDVLICVDFSGFNRRVAHSVREYVRQRRGWFHGWNPKIVQYVSPQVWASREGRAQKMARDYDLLLSIFPFEKEWYARRTPGFRVEFVGHPIVDRYKEPPKGGAPYLSVDKAPKLLLLPGSRPGELTRHLPVMLGAFGKIRQELPNVRAMMVLPNESLLKLARTVQVPEEIEIKIGGLAEALAQAMVAIASTGTVTMECAYFGVPAVALYKTSWFTFQVGKRVATVSFMAMPNLMANEEVFPEFIQDAATPENIADAAIDLLKDSARRERMRQRLKEITASLGQPGASRRAARAILRVMKP
jgi:lipid-A-disaccharide synthase